MGIVGIDFGVTSDWTQRIGEMLLHSLWQIAVVGLVFAIGRSVIRLASAKRAAVWTYAWGCFCMAGIVAVSLATLMMSGSESRLAMSENSGVENNFVDQSVVSGFELSGTLSQTSALEEMHGKMISSSGFDTHWIVMGWLVGVAIILLRPMLAYWNIRRLKNSAVQTVPGRVVKAGRRLCDQLGIGHVEFIVSKSVDVPMVFGMFKPVIFLPMATLSGLTTQQVEHLLAHELAHISRNDFIVYLLQTIFEAAFFYHPLTWWLSHQLRIERENCCDDIAVQMTDDAKGYATTLATLATLATTQVEAPAMAAGSMDLLKRIERLLGKRHLHSSFWQAQVCFAVVIGVAIAGIFATSTDLEASNRRDFADRVVESEATDEAIPATDFLNIGQQEHTTEATDEEEIDAKTNQTNQAIMHLIQQEANRLGIEVGGKQVTDHITGLAAEFGLSVEVFRKSVEARREQSDEWTNFRETVRFNLIVTEMVKDQVVVTEEDIRDEYERKYGLQADFLYCVCDEKSKAIRFWQMAKDLDAEDFAKLATQLSKDECTRYITSRLGPAASTAASNAIFSMQPGEVSNVIQERSSYIVVYLNRFIQPAKPAFEEARLELSDSVYRRKLQEALAKKHKQFRDLGKKSTRPATETKTSLKNWATPISELR